MYSDFVKNLPKKSKDFENFLVKGLRAPLAKMDSPLAQVIFNYFNKKENFLVFTSPFSGKLEAIEEIAKSLHNFVILTNKTQLEDVSKRVNGPVFSEDNSIDLTKFDHVILYNTKIDLTIKNVHISGFYDYVGLYNPSEYKSYVNSFLINENINFTTICKYPHNKEVEFIFGTDNKIKHLAIVNSKLNSTQSNTMIYCQNEVNSLIKNYLIKSGEILQDFKKCEKLIFYDLNADLLQEVLEKIDKVTIIYTIEDFEKLSETVTILKGLGVVIPDFILELVKNKKN
jgi:hypothetical protein